jgi:large subunit ribosomal protein L13
METKKYIRHTTYPGGQRETLAKDLLAKKPEALIEKAVKGMLPKNRLGNKIFHNLFVYAGPNHPHAAQKPESIEL